MTQPMDETADAFFRAVEQGDVESIANLYCDDVRVWHNFTNRHQTREENLDLLRTFRSRVEHMKIVVEGREHFPGGFVQRHTLVIAYKSGKKATVPTCVVAHLREGKVAQLFEYLDPAAVRGQPAQTESSQLR